MNKYIVLEKAKGAARPHKYIKKIPKKSGMGFQYVYKESTGRKKAAEDYVAGKVKTAKKIGRGIKEIGKEAIKQAKPVIKEKVGQAKEAIKKVPKLIAKVGKPVMKGLANVIGKFADLFEKLTRQDPVDVLANDLENAGKKGFSVEDVLAYYTKAYSEKQEKEKPLMNIAQANDEAANLDDEVSEMLDNYSNFRKETFRLVGESGEKPVKFEDKKTTEDLKNRYLETEINSIEVLARLDNLERWAKVKSKPRLISLAKNLKEKINRGRDTLIHGGYPGSYGMLGKIVYPEKATEYQKKESERKAGERETYIAEAPQREKIEAERAKKEEQAYQTKKEAEKRKQEMDKKFKRERVQGEIKELEGTLKEEKDPLAKQDYEEQIKIKKLISKGLMDQAHREERKHIVARKVREGIERRQTYKYVVKDLEEKMKTGKGKAKAKISINKNTFGGSPEPSIKYLIKAKRDK